MVTMILRENDVNALSRPVFACGAKNRCRPIGLKITMGSLWPSPDTMAVFILRENDVTPDHAQFSPAAQKIDVLRSSSNSTWESF